MPASEPSWWYGRDGAWQATLLSPVAAVYGSIASRRILNAKPYRSSLPVICVGNFTAGGSGKTPLALLLGKLAAEEGREPWFLSRGYGGKLAGPVRVEPARHEAWDVGDEPLLLARAFPTIIARDRRKGAEAIEALAPNNAVIIMDDGLQNPALAKTLSIAVIDAVRGLGNGHVIPAGPLRAPLGLQMMLAQLIVIAGQQSSEDRSVARAIRKLTDLPIVVAETRPRQDAMRFRGGKVLAFAGIANPDRFFSMLQSLGATIIEKRIFADHHPFSGAEAQALVNDAERLGATLVTTEKDLARLSGSLGPRADLKSRSQALAIETVIESTDLETVRSALRRALSR